MSDNRQSGEFVQHPGFADDFQEGEGGMIVGRCGFCDSIHVYFLNEDGKIFAGVSLSEDSATGLGTQMLKLSRMIQ